MGSQVMRGTILGAGWQQHNWGIWKCKLLPNTYHAFLFLSVLWNIKQLQSSCSCTPVNANTFSFVQMLHPCMDRDLGSHLHEWSCVCKMGVSVINLFFSNWSKDKLMHGTLVLFVLCKQELICV